MDIEQLPDEVCLKILQFVPQRELVLLMKVCWRWKRLCNDSVLWRNIEMNCSDPNWLHKLNCIASLHPNIRSLLLYGNNNIYNPPIQCSPTTKELRLPPDWVWTNLEGLHSLKLHFCQREVVDLIPEIFRHCPHIRVLACEGSREFSIETHFTACMQEDRRYTELSFAHSTTLEDASFCGAVQSTAFIGCIRCLRSLNLDGIPFLTDKGVLSVLTHCPNLLTLALDGEQLTDTAACFIGDSLALRSLSISFCNNLTDEALISFCKLKTLDTLSLKKGQNFSDCSFVRLFEALGSPGGGGLRDLSLVECKGLLDTGVRALAQHCPRLVHLDLSWCWNLTDDCLEPLVAQCRYICTLKLVGLRGAQCAAILGAPMEHIQLLDLTQCHLVNDTKLQTFKRNKPNTTVIDYWGEIVDT